MQCLKDARKGTYKPRSHAGLGKGSHPMLQRVVEPAIRCCTKPKPTYGIWTCCACAQAGGSATCLPRAQAHHNAHVNAHGIALRPPADKGTLCPPAPHLALRVPPTIFPHFFHL